MLKLKSKLLLIIGSLLMLWVFKAAAVAAAPPAQGAVCAEDYTVQAGDWLSTIAEKYYGDPLAYPVLVEATNLAAQADSKYTPITDPATIEVSQVLCIPDQAEAMAQLEQSAASLEPGQTALEPGRMLLIVGNRSLQNLPATFTLSGEEFGDGQEFTLEPGQEQKWSLSPGDYRAAWSLPNGVTARDFEAVADLINLVWLVPEDNQVFAQQQWAGSLAGAPRGKTELGHVHLPSVQTTDTPYRMPADQALLVAGNRSYESLYALFGLVGGRFGQGRGFLLAPEEETLLLLEPGAYQIIWLAGDPAEPETILRRGEATVDQGQVVVTWLSPELRAGYIQPVGQPGLGLESFGPPSEVDAALLARLVDTARLDTQ
jgi:hypothetical protein